MPEDLEGGLVVDLAAGLTVLFAAIAGADFEETGFLPGAFAPALFAPFAIFEDAEVVLDLDADLGEAEDLGFGGLARASTNSALRMACQPGTPAFLALCSSSLRVSDSK